MHDEWVIYTLKMWSRNAVDLAHPARVLVYPPRVIASIRFCPFRFRHGDKSKGEDSAALDRPAGGSAEEPPPPMFGVGRHTCPGRELAKLEMLLFLKAFLSKFDYEVVEGQSFKGVLPANAPKDKLKVVLRMRSAAD